jgi:hypothetical protein
VVNKNGISEFLCIEAVRDKIPAMPAPRQEVPAWIVSQIGLTPESTYTSSWNPAIFLASQAPHLLRLAYYTKDDFFRAVGRAAVVGRYSNYPGYDIDGEFNTVYSRPDYPLRFQHEVSYNQFYYNHVWPQIALLFDYLISDVYASSNGGINFPPEFAVGYAYLKSNVYGQAPGSFYGDKNVNIWMPKQVLKVDNEQVNYLTAYGNGKFYIAFLNQSDRAQEAEVQINPTLVPVYGNHSYRIWKDNVAAGQGKTQNERLKVQVSPKGITAIAINDVNIVTQFQQKMAKDSDSSSPQSYRMVDSPFGKIRSSVLSFGELSNAFIWLEAYNDTVKSATLSYRITGQKDWKTVTDSSYPYEFSIPMSEKDREIEWSVKAEMSDGKINSSSSTTLKR